MQYCIIRVCVMVVMQSIYIIKFVCLFVSLFVRDSGKKYCTEHHQTLRDFNVEL